MNKANPMLKLQSSTSETVVESVLVELRKFDQDAFILCGSGDDDESGPSGRACYLLQKWSNKWGAYVDVATVSSSEVEMGIS